MGMPVNFRNQAEDTRKKIAASFDPKSVDETIARIQRLNAKNGPELKRYMDLQESDDWSKEDKEFMSDEDRVKRISGHYKLVTALNDRLASYRNLESMVTAPTSALVEDTIMRVLESADPNTGTVDLDNVTSHDERERYFNQADIALFASRRPGIKIYIPEEESDGVVYNGLMSLRGIQSFRNDPAKASGNPISPLVETARAPYLAVDERPFSSARSVVSHIGVRDATPYAIPTYSDVDNRGQQKAEAEALTDEELKTMGKNVLGIKNVSSGLIPVTMQAIAAVGSVPTLSPVSFAIEEAMARLDNSMNNGIINGDGTSENVHGLINQATQQTGSLSFSADPNTKFQDGIDFLLKSVPHRYLAYGTSRWGRRGGRYVRRDPRITSFVPGSIALITTADWLAEMHKKWVDGQMRPLVTVDNVTGTPMVKGPVAVPIRLILDDYMPTVFAAGITTMLYGDFSPYFVRTTGGRLLNVFWDSATHTAHRGPTIVADVMWDGKCVSDLKNSACMSIAKWVYKT